MSNSRGCRRLEETQVLSSESQGVSGFGSKLSLLGVVYEPIGILGELTTSDTSEAAGHLCRSLRFAKCPPLLSLPKFWEGNQISEVSVGIWCFELFWKFQAYYCVSTTGHL